MEGSFSLIAVTLRYKKDSSAITPVKSSDYQFLSHGKDTPNKKSEFGAD